MASKTTKARRLPHIAARIFGTPLAIEPRKLSAILNALGPHLDLAELEGAMPTPDTKADRKPYVVKDGVATINILGSLVHRATGLDALSGLTTYQQISAELTLAENDPDVKSVLLCVDSPGGEVSGMFDTAARVRAMTKPTVAIAQDMAASAAYLIASAADKTYISQSGILGSIGIVLAHTDTSAADASAGVKVSYIHSGAHKVDGAMPLDHEHRDAAAALQAEVDHFGTMFIEAAAGYRGISPDTVRKMEARVYIGAEAVKMGLADGVCTMDDVVKTMSKGVAPSYRADRGTTLAPFGPYKDFAECVAQNQDKEDPEAYCGKIKHEVEGSLEESLLSGDSPDGEEEELGMAEKSTNKVLSLDEFKAENERLTAMLAESNANTAAKDAALASIEEERKSEVIEKHVKRGAIVPAMMDAVKDLAAVKKTGADLDAALAKWPVILKNTPAGSSADVVLEDKVPGAETPLAKLQAIGKTIADAKGLTKEAGFAEACNQNPGLYKAHRMANPLGSVQK